MIKALLDTNVIIDAVVSREPFCKEAKEILILAAEDNFSGFAAGSSITDIYYIVRKLLSRTEAHDVIKALLDVLGVVSVGKDECTDAVESGMADFEDAVVAVCAARVKADFIVSRDKVFAKSALSVPVLTPAKFLAKLHRS